MPTNKLYKICKESFWIAGLSNVPLWVYLWYPPPAVICRQNFRDKIFSKKKIRSSSAKYYKYVIYKAYLDPLLLNN